MQKNMLFIFGMLLIFFQSSCGELDGDKLAKEKIMRQWGEKYDMTFSFQDIYVYLKLKRNIVLNKDEIEQVFKDFFMINTDFKKERKSAYVYMNIYDYKGKFLYQLYLDKEKGKISYSSSDAY